MKIQDFLKHHGISRNPFAEEDAQTDIVFKNHCIDSTFHVGWDKMFGDPRDPSTSIVFGEKGSGKTAIKLQIAQHVEDHNRTHPDEKLFLIHYDDFNPYLDCFRDHFGPRFRRAEKLLGAWRLWDHMDAILSQGVTSLVDWILDGAETSPPRTVTRSLPKHLGRDLLLLTACYDQSKSQAMPSRWSALRRRLGFWTWRAKLPLLAGGIGTLAAAALFIAKQAFSFEAVASQLPEPWTFPDFPWWVYAIILGAGWLPWTWKACQRSWLAFTVTRRYRVGKRYTNPLRRVLMNFTGRELLGQPMPNKDRTDDRYELLGKLQNVLEHFGFGGMLVLMDRVDEPHLINGQAELMRAFVWPILDNKFLKHPGTGIKMMLPIELRRYVDREDRDFYQRARLDKQNMIPSLQWTGEALYDLAGSRITAVAADGASPSLRSIFDESISDQRLIDAFQSLRVPRHLFKFLYRLFVAHCNAFTDDSPSWQISDQLFESILAVYATKIEAADAGVGV